MIIAVSTLAVSTFLVIYDPSLEEYSDTTIKNSAWAKVAEMLGKDGGYMHKKVFYCTVD